MDYDALIAEFKHNPSKELFARIVFAAARLPQPFRIMVCSRGYTNGGFQCGMQLQIQDQSRPWNFIGTLYYWDPVILRDDNLSQEVALQNRLLDEVIDLRLQIGRA